MERNERGAHCKFDSLLGEIFVAEARVVVVETLFPVREGGMRTIEGGSRVAE